jgi:hypothetical protein
MRYVIGASVAIDANLTHRGSQYLLRIYAALVAAKPFFTLSYEESG